MSGVFLKIGRLFLSSSTSAFPQLNHRALESPSGLHLATPLTLTLYTLNTYLFLQTLPGTPLAVLVFIIGGGLAVPAFAFSHHMAMFKGK